MMERNLYSSSLVWTLIIVLLSIGGAFGGEIKITGRVLFERQEGLPVTIYLCKDLYALSDPDLKAIKYETLIRDSTFSVQMQTPDSLVYIQLVFGKDTWPRSAYRRLNGKFFLLRPDSYIGLHIAGDTCSFSGTGSELMECQYRMTELMEHTGVKETTSYYQGLRKQKEIFELRFNKLQGLLESYKSKLIPQEISLLKTDFFADYHLLILKSLRLEMAENEVYKEQNIGALRFYAENYLYGNLSDLDVQSLAVSRSLAEFLFTKNLLDLGFIMRITDSSMRPTFRQLYERINRLYGGPLRERLLTLAFIRYYKMGEADSKIFDSALNSIRIQPYREVVERIKDALAEDRMVYDFSLTDSTGQKITAGMLRGKLLVLDFWFTGCGGCAYLNEQMRPVYDYYKGNDQVVFVSINTDKDEARWKRGLASGGYTHPESLKLFTNGQGKEDPLIKYYNVSVMPTLILIGKDGRLISASPPKPDTEEGRIRFVRLIDRYLKK